MSEYGYCVSTYHNSGSSEYAKDKVPIELFHLHRNTIKKKFTQCEDCRRDSAEKRKAVKEERERKFEESRNSGSKYLYCPYRYHNLISEYPTNKVPRENFEKKISKNLHDECYDCRHRDEYEKDGELIFFCSSCCNKFPVEEKNITKDGYPGKCCKHCVEVNKKAKTIVNARIARVQRDVKIEYVRKNEACCEMCKRILLNNPDWNDVEDDDPFAYELLILDTFIMNGERVVEYDGKIYNAKRFLIANDENLQLTVLEYDHLTETEQRERGLLGKKEKFIPKLNEVANCKSETTIRAEAKKCQLICCECHKRVTAERIIEERTTEYELNTRTTEKIEYVRNVKKAGCECCGYADEDLPSFLEFDHINPENKIMAVGTMIREYSYTVEDIIDEIEKCRILCTICHRVRTLWQRNDEKEAKLRSTREVEESYSTSEIEDKIIISLPKEICLASKVEKITYINEMIKPSKAIETKTTPIAVKTIKMKDSTNKVRKSIKDVEKKITISTTKINDEPSKSTSITKSIKAIETKTSSSTTKVIKISNSTGKTKKLANKMIESIETKRTSSTIKTDKLNSEVESTWSEVEDSFIEVEDSFSEVTDSSSQVEDSIDEIRKAVDIKNQEKSTNTTRKVKTERILNTKESADKPKKQSNKEIISNKMKELTKKPNKHNSSKKK